MSGRLNTSKTARAEAATLALVCLAAIAVLFGLWAAASIMAPVMFALFTIAVVWPLQRILLQRLPNLLATAITVLVTIVAISALLSLMIWGFGRAAQWLFDNAARFQAFYAALSDWLESHDLYAASLFTEYFNIPWLIRLAQQVTGRFHGMLTFTFVTLIFVLLGLLEVRVVRRKLELMTGETARICLEACSDIAAKFQRYIVIRTAMSVATGFGVFALTSLFGIDLAVEWGVIAFALNYIPFLGPLVATLFPTLFTAAQFETWQMPLVMFIGLNLIQFTIGSYIEPRIAGARLAISPFLVLLAVFFWAFLWGIPGAFIGVPILIAFVTFLQHFPSTRPVGMLLAGEEKREKERSA
ncbi:AI-2E family transporter [Terrihabitans soli]|uniref:AI-2E family transporter n=1 Tax=Terrihabitans soli TaxID=708113 RepID=A0A6S6QIA6_9HYPH|nr:AI-2E family transporter [Terrihabitans soli]BCJ90973.1 AI-2E family transporter [Terrihabitans soli]